MSCLSEITSDTRVELPSPNSAFKKFEIRSDVTPSVARRANLFGSDPPGGARELLAQEIAKEQSSFQLRWSCRCDSLTLGHVTNDEPIPKRPACSDWRPISQSQDELPYLLKRLALARISVENLTFKPMRSLGVKSCQRSDTKRPDSPVPFQSGQLRCKRNYDVNSGTINDSGRPSLFNLNERIPSTSFHYDEDKEVELAGSPRKITQENRGCLTPPLSPLKFTPVSSREDRRKASKQRKITDWYRPRKTSHRLRHQSSLLSTSWPRPETSKVAKERRRGTAMKKNFRFSAEF